MQPDHVNSANSLIKVVFPLQWGGEAPLEEGVSSSGTSVSSSLLIASIGESLI